MNEMQDNYSYDVQEVRLNEDEVVIGVIQGSGYHKRETRHVARRDESATQGYRLLCGNTRSLYDGAPTVKQYGKAVKAGINCPGCIEAAKDTRREPPYSVKMVKAMVVWHFNAYGWQIDEDNVLLKGSSIQRLVVSVPEIHLSEDNSVFEVGYDQVVITAGHYY